MSHSEHSSLCPRLSDQVLYPILPGLLDCNPFRESPDQQVTDESTVILGSSGLQVPREIQQVVEVLNEAWVLLSDCQLHPEISSQLIGYLFYFINASLVNSLMERGTTCQQPQPPTNQITGIVEWCRNES